MKFFNTRTPKRLWSMLLSIVLVCTMLCSIIIPVTAVSEAATKIDQLFATLDENNIVEADAKAINKIVALYETLGASEKTQYEERVTAAKTAILALVKQGYTRFTSYTTDFWSTNWWFGFTKGTDYDTFMSDQNGPNPDIGLAGQQMVTFDGLEIKFDNLVKMSVGNGSKPDATGIGVTFDTEIDSKYATYQKGLLLYIDADKGNLVLNKDGSSKYLELISGSDVLKLASLEQNAFTLAINATGDDDAPYKVTIKTVDGQSVDANIPADCFNATNVLVDGKTYVTFVCTGYDSNGTYPIGPSHVSYNIIGYRNNNEARANIETINNLLATLDVNTITETSAKAVNEMMVLYATLNTADKLSITDNSKVAAINNKLLTLKKDGYTRFTSYTKDFWSDNWWFEFTKGTDYDTFMSDQNGPGPDTALAGQQAVAFDGLELKFDNFVKIANGNGSKPDATGIGVTFDTTVTPDFASTQKGLLLYIDADKGNLILNADGTSKYKELITNSNVLKLATLERNTFTLAINATDNDDAPYKVTIKTADGQSANASIPADCFNDANVLIGENTYVAFVCTGYDSNHASPIGPSHASYNIIGYRNCKGAEENIAFVNAKLATLTPETMTEADVEDVKKIAALYSAMIPSEKAQITGSEKIPALQAKIYEVIKYGYEVYTEDHFLATSYHWANSPSNLEHHMENGLLRVTFKAGSSPHPAYMGQVIEPVSFDGLEYKFNNFTINNPAAANAGVAMIFTPNYAFKPDFSDGAKAPGLLLYIDIKNGKLILNYRAYNESTTYGEGGNVTYTEILTDNAIKDLVGKVFTVKISSTNDVNNPYKVSIVTSGSTPIEANIPKEYFSEEAVFVAGTKTTFVQFAMGCYGSNLTHAGHGSMDNSYDIVGYRNIKNANFINEQLATLDVNAITEADAKKVNKIVNMYTGMSGVERTFVTDPDKLIAINNKLINELKSGYTEIANYTQDWWGGAWFIDGTIYDTFNIKSSNLNPARRIGPKAALPLDGLELMFNNFRKTGAGTSTGFGILLAPSAGFEFKKNSNQGLLLYLDAETGSLILNLNGASKYKELITNNELLKLENLENNAFSFKITKNDDATKPYKVTITTTDGHSVNADIPAEFFNASSVLIGDNTYVTFTAGRYDENAEPSHAEDNDTSNDTIGIEGSTSTAFTVIGHNNDTILNRTNALIARIPETVTVNDGNAINLAYTYYNLLPEYQKIQVTGYDKLVDAIPAYKTAFEASIDDKWTVLKEDAQLNSAVGTINTFGWGTDFATWLGGKSGLRMNVKNGGLNYRISPNNAVNMNGLEILFNRWIQTGGLGEFAITFSNTVGQQLSATGDPIFAVVINANDGTLKVSTAWNRDKEGGGEPPVYFDVIQDDLLKYENIGGGKFTIGFKKATGGAYTVKVTVGDQSVEGTIPAQAFADARTTLSNPGQCFMQVMGWRPATQNIDTVGYISYPDVDPEEVMTWIEALPPTVTSSNYEQFDKIYTKYLLANDEQKAGITNIDKFFAKMGEYRKQLSFETDMFPYKYLSITTNYWPGRFEYREIENDGGVRLTWRNTGLDVRQGYNSKVFVDGLKLQFNAMHKTSDSSADPKFTVVFTDTNSTMWTYPSTTKPFAFVIDTVEGAVYAQPANVRIIQSDLLKYENLKYKTFYLEMNLNKDGDWDVEVSTPDGVAKGVMDAEVFLVGQRYQNLDYEKDPAAKNKEYQAYLTLTVWERTSATIEWTGIGQTTKHVPVTEMIDELLVVDKDSEPAIEAAERAYEALPDYAKARVSNYSILEKAREKFAGLKDGDPVPFVIEKINSLGKIDITKKPLIDEVEDWYNTLTKAQKARVTNAKVLEDAIDAYYKLFAVHMDWDSCVYAPDVTTTRNTQEELDSWWGGTFKMRATNYGGSHFTFVNAGRDHRNGFGKYSLDGLNVQLANFKKTGEGKGTGILALYIDYYGYYYVKGLRTGIAKSTMAVVLDTNKGTVTLYPIGKTTFTKPIEIFNDPALKYENITGKNFNFLFEEIDSNTYTMRLIISDGHVLSGVIPARFITPLKNASPTGNLNSVYVQISAWDDKTNQEVEIVSIRDGDSKSAVSQIMPVVETIEDLPETATLDAEHDIRKANKAYRSLMLKGLKGQVSNYGKLKRLLEDLSELWDTNDIDPYQYEEPEEEEEEELVSLANYDSNGKVFNTVPIVNEKVETKSSIIMSVSTCFAALLAFMLIETKKSKLFVKKEEEN